MDSSVPLQGDIRVPSPPPRVSDGGVGFAEVVIRTMASDLKSLGESGGLGARGETIAVPIRPTTPSAPPIPYTRIVIRTLMALAGLGFLFLIGYYFIPALLGGAQE